MGIVIAFAMTKTFCSFFSFLIITKTNLPHIWVGFFG
jgi:hypothetical protein